MHLCGLITRHVLCVSVRVVNLGTPFFQNSKQQRSRMNRAPLFQIRPDYAEQRINKVQTASNC